MAEIACESCGHGYYDTLAKCPKCAAPTVIRVHDPRPKYRRIANILMGASFLAFVLMEVFNASVLVIPVIIAFVAGAIMHVVSNFALRGIDDH